MFSHDVTTAISLLKNLVLRAFSLAWGKGPGNEVGCSNIKGGHVGASKQSSFVVIGLHDCWLWEKKRSIGNTRRYCNMSISAILRKLLNKRR